MPKKSLDVTNGKNSFGVDGQIELAKWYYETHALRFFDGAHDHSQAVLKHAFLVSGGALIAVPSLTTLGQGYDASYAIAAGGFFGASLICLLFASYCIQVSWRAAARAADLQFRIKLEKQYGEQAPALLLSLESDSDPHKSLDRFEKLARRTFWLPHFLAFAYLFAMIAGMVLFYLAFVNAPPATS